MDVSNSTNYRKAAAILLKGGDTLTITQEERMFLLTLVAEMDRKIESAEHNARNARNFIRNIIGEDK